MVKTNHLSVSLLMPKGGFLPLCFQTFTDVYHQLRRKDNDVYRRYRDIPASSQMFFFFYNLTPQMNKSHSSVHML